MNFIEALQLFGYCILFIILIIYFAFSYIVFMNLYRIQNIWIRRLASILSSIAIAFALTSAINWIFSNLFAYLIGIFI